MTYDEWEKTQEFSPVSPEAFYAELAWKAASAQLTKIYQAVLVTRHFHFECCGRTADEAREALIRGLRVHGTQFDIDPDWWMEGFEGVPTDEIFEVHEFELGVAYRDNQPLRTQ